ncbi:MAG: glutamate synthase subunit alpha, partial [Candidatus Omnitrophica bacterium]|nr:glutamate synthase subunit alpha [Candidatus Omnitrophota bacterium]
MRRIGLYDPAFEHDSCGVGFVASITGQASRHIVEWAIQCVCNVTHRGAVSADAKTGDGAGVETQLPYRFFAKVLADLKRPVPAPGDLALGMVFLPQDPTHNQQARAIIEEITKTHTLGFLGWRKVPVDVSVLGDSGKRSLPDIQQVFLSRPSTIPPAAFDRTLFLVRRGIEKQFERDGFTDCYLPSCSSKVIVYKGLLVAPQLARFYPDLRDPDFVSSLAVFHQRYSTNTFPTWHLAQPFRLLAHNGEINTLRGNRNWMAAREPELSSSVWGDALTELLPIVQEHGSDSMSLDNVLELVVMSGRDLLQAMMMLVPDAWQSMPDMDPALKAFYQYHAMLVEPWDGPAALAFTDGTIVGACLDRNGLRPARYWVTDEGIVIMSSEVGVVDLPASRIVEKGRLGPGHIIAVHQGRKQLLTSETIKREYAAAKPYAEWVAKSLVALGELSTRGTPEPDAPVDVSTLLRQHTSFGYTQEELDMVI